MHKSSATIYLIVILSSLNAVGQTNTRSLTKVGGFLNFNHPSGFGGFIFSLENERVISKNNSFTHGPRLDYEKAKKNIQPNSFFFGLEDLIVGYQLKVYPFHFKNRKPYQGIFIGAYPCYFLPINNLYKNGPGIGSLIGYQYVFKDKISLSAEASMIYMQNVNKASPYRNNPEDRYYYFTPSIKVGFKLGVMKVR